MNEHKNIITIEDEIKEFSDKPVKSSALFKALKESGGGRVVKCTGTAETGEVGTFIPLDISAEEFTAAFTAATASPLYILLPKITEESPYYSYDDDGYPDWLGMYLIEGHVNNDDNFTINGSQDSVVATVTVSDLAIMYPDSPDEPMELVIPGGK